MNDLLLSPLGPAIVLGVAGGILRFFARPQRASTLALLAGLPLGLTVVLLMGLRFSGVQVWQLPWWPLVTAPQPVLWALDGWNWLASMLLLLVGTSALLLTWRWPGRRTGPFHGMNLLLLTGAMVTVVSDNLLALSGIWVATDILLIARARGGRPQAGAAPVGLVAGGSLLVFLAIGITGLETATASLAATALPIETLILLTLASTLRMAAYPLHLWLAPGSVARDRGTQWLVNGTALITGAWLLGRLYSLGLASLIQGAIWPPLLAFLVVVAGLAAWGSRPKDRPALLSSGRATWLVLVLALGPVSAGRSTLGWALLAVVIGLTLHAVGQVIWDNWGWRLPLFLSAAVLAGVPLTAGMPARALGAPTDLLLWLMLIIGDGLAVACVLGATGAPRQQQPRREDTPPAGRLNWPVIRLLVAFGPSAVLALLWGLRPESLAVQAGFEGAPSFTQLAGALGFGGLLAVVLSLAFGASLAWLMNVPDAQIQTLRTRLAQITGLAWALSGLGWLLAWLEAGWRTVLLIFEGEGYFGWLALIVVVAGLIILQI